MRILVTVLLVCACCGYCLADDVVSMPTANQLKAGEVDIAAYYFGLDSEASEPQNVNLQQVCIGLTNKIELDAYRADVDKDKAAVVVTGYYRLLSENLALPDVVVGCKNLLGERTTNGNPAKPWLPGKSEDRSYFICASKTVFLTPAIGRPPLVRVHAGLGTADWTLLAEDRHKGLFGGLQFLVTPQIGAVVQHDGQDTITGLSYMPPDTGLTIKAGTFGDHWWAGVAYRKSLMF